MYIYFSEPLEFQIETPVQSDGTVKKSSSPTANKQSPLKFTKNCGLRSSAVAIPF